MPSAGQKLARQTTITCTHRSDLAKCDPTAASFGRAAAAIALQSLEAALICAGEPTHQVDIKDRAGSHNDLEQHGSHVESMTAAESRHLREMRTPPQHSSCWST